MPWGSHHLNQCQPRFMLSYIITRPQSVKILPLCGTVNWTENSSYQITSDVAQTIIHFKYVNLNNQYVYEICVLHITYFLFYISPSTKYIKSMNVSNNWLGSYFRQLLSSKAPQEIVVLNTLEPGQNGHNFPHNIFKCIFFNENVSISITISLKFSPKGPINNIPALL